MLFNCLTQKRARDSTKTVKVYKDLKTIGDPVNTPLKSVKSATVSKTGSDALGVEWMKISLETGITYTCMFDQVIDSNNRNEISVTKQCQNGKKTLT